MAAGSSYPASIIDMNGNVREGQTIRFEDSTNQPGNSASPTFTGTVTVPAAAAATSAPQLDQLTSALTITSGALPNTGAWVSGTAKQNPTTVSVPARQVTVNVEVAFDGTNNAAQCVIAISEDNSTYTTIGTPSVSAAINAVGATTSLVPVSLPAAWYIKLTFTATHTTVAASVYY